MRYSTPLIAFSAAFCVTTVHAQVIGIPHRSVPTGQPSFHIQSFGSPPRAGVPLPPVQGRSVGSAAGSQLAAVTLRANTYTCPMPVAHTDCAKVDSMPVVRGGVPEPMPVAMAGCWNPLGPMR
jgi:hypothetical protein